MYIKYERIKMVHTQKENVRTLQTKRKGRLSEERTTVWKTKVKRRAKGKNVRITITTEHKLFNFWIR